MLVLARKKGQSIIIGKDIRIVVVDILGETVRLGIEAPHEYEIFRTEIYQQIQEENLESVTSIEKAIGFLEKNLSNGSKNKK